jgi:hypothetical protein
MPKSYSRWGDVRPRRIDAALGARKLLREALGFAGAITSDLLVVLLGSTVREAVGTRRLRQYHWYRLPRAENVLGELFLASIPHPSPLASRAFNQNGVARLLNQACNTQARYPTRARGAYHIKEMDLVALEE